MRIKSMKTHRLPVCIILMSSFFLTGCGRVSENSLSEILEKDPSFRNVLDAKKNISRKALSLRESFDKEKEIITQKIDSLKASLQEKKDYIEKEKLAVRQGLQPMIDTLKVKLEEARSEYTEKKALLKDSLGKAKNIKKLLVKKEELALSGDEISIWNKRAANLEQEINKLKKRLVELENKTRLLKTEIKILRE